MLIMNSTVKVVVLSMAPVWVACCPPSASRLRDVHVADFGRL